MKPTEIGDLNQTSLKHLPSMSQSVTETTENDKERKRPKHYSTHEQHQAETDPHSPLLAKVLAEGVVV